MIILMSFIIINKIEKSTTALNLMNQKHFRCTYEAPWSWNSCLVMNISLKLERDARIDPPIQAEYFLSGGSTTTIFIVDGARAVTSLCSLSFISTLSRSYF